MSLAASRWLTRFDLVDTEVCHGERPFAGRQEGSETGTRVSAVLASGETGSWDSSPGVSGGELRPASARDSRYRIRRASAASSAAKASLAGVAGPGSV